MVIGDDCFLRLRTLPSGAMDTINELLECYAEIEQSVRTLMNELFSGTCGMCTACCCRADICEEAVESTFLSKLLNKQGLKASDLDDRYGWLDLGGCSLEYGRPPVCYAYFCDQLMARLPSDDCRLTAQVLGRLMQHIGQEVLNGWDLTDIKNEEDLLRVDLAPIHQRMEEAQAALEVIMHFLKTDRLNAEDRQTLAVITTDEL